MLLTFVFFTLIQDEFKCEMTLNQADKKDYYTFDLKVKTNLPDLTLVNVSVVYLWEKDMTENLTDYKLKYIPVRIKSGQFEIETYKFKKRPYSGKYRVKMTAELKDQDDKGVMAKLEPKAKEGKIEFIHDASFGTLEDYRKEIKLSANYLQKDFKRIRKLYEDLKETFTKQQKNFDEKTWDNFDKDLKEKMLPIEEANSIRFSWGFDIEKFGQMSIDQMVDTIKKLLGESKTALKTKKKEDLQQAMETLNLFVKYYDRTIEDLGLDSPDPEVIKPYIDSMEGIIKAISDGKEDKKDIQVRATQIFMKLSQVATLKGYQYVLLIQEKLELALEDKTKLKELKEAVEEFKTFVGIK